MFDATYKETMMLLKRYCTPVRPYAHYALKYTGFAPMMLFKKWSRAQNELMDGWFRRYASQSDGGYQVATQEDLKRYLIDHDISFTDSEFDDFI